MSYRCFTRRWWKPNPSWPDGREPDATGRKTTKAVVETIEEARAVCTEYNATHKPGKLSIKCEFENSNRRPTRCLTEHEIAAIERRYR